MRFKDSIKISLIALRANKSRSFLTVLGIVIGVGAVIIMMSLGKGAQGLILGQFSSMGSKSISIEPGSFDPKSGFSQGYESAIEEMTIKTMKIKDAEDIKKNPLIENVAAYVFGVGRVIYGNNDEKITFYGATETFHEIDDVYPALGRGLTSEDVEGMAKVAVLGNKIAENLFGDEDPIGKKIRIKNVNLKVVGVLEEKGTQMFVNIDELVYLPITTAQKLLLGSDSVRWIVAKAVSEDVVPQAMEDIRLTLRENHNIYNPEGDLSKDDFKVMSQVETADMVKQVTGILTAFLSSIAAIALIVGGIGIMNIMLVSVTERTREIGLRKAVGARNKDILRQFLIESITLTLLGGLIGFVGGTMLSFLSSFVLSKALNTSWSFVMPFGAVVLAFGVAAIVGLIFGIYPARKAAKLNPIEALRHE
ncbi:MAG: multidrug ABC transporter substrate-binding protein [Candidatus Portnoybacteria bacterium CG10_big_fil_rev_8_21_14_0_10_38_18]|uniref:Multidrug ABC transporter substrate-binding protein n=1 Tax=Candidatus Portnoybacteria bacterium CG10_big_fil_rev_8_21_14_0_10_38_18 TaxID=1974813 RepID=A0A2M8KC14_9BACT|nr:MAG: multidrug ABC transporter substrate-binding protein [Candidatus Portnoybacteria bacterium CG10_big_fil_rev_8_21_14_0_10_38_18]